MTLRPVADIEIDAFTVWEDVIDFCGEMELKGVSTWTEFDAELIHATDFSGEARHIVWELAKALKKSPNWTPRASDG